MNNSQTTDTTVLCLDLHLTGLSSVVFSQPSAHRDGECSLEISH